MTDLITAFKNEESEVLPQSSDLEREEVHLIVTAEIYQLELPDSSSIHY